MTSPVDFLPSQEQGNSCSKVQPLKSTPYGRNYEANCKENKDITSLFAEIIEKEKNEKPKTSNKFNPIEEECPTVEEMFGREYSNGKWDGCSLQ